VVLKGTLQRTTKEKRIRRTAEGFITFSEEGKESGLNLMKIIGAGVVEDGSEGTRKED